MLKAKMLDVRNRRIIDPAQELASKDAIIRDLKDALEFSERVAAKLATMLDESYYHIDTGSYESCREVCPAHSLCPKGFNPDCRANFVKYARLAVEEEMDADIQAKD